MDLGNLPKHLTYRYGLSGNQSQLDAQQPVTVLVVDDEPDVLAMLDRALQRYGYTTLLAHDGTSGVEQFRAYAANIKCVVMDFMMPGMNGIQLFRAIRQINPNISVVLMSGADASEALHLLVPEGLAGFLAKPFTISELRIAIHTAVTLTSELPLPIYMTAII